MTNEEAKRRIELLISTMREETSGSYPDSPYKDQVYVALDMAFKALMQMDILDKIRSEIEQLPITDTAIRLVTEIFDKYKQKVRNKE